MADKFIGDTIDGVGVTVDVTAGVEGGVAEGVAVLVAAGVFVGVGVEVLVGVTAGVSATGVPVLVGVGVGDDPTTGVGVGDAVGVTVAAALGNGVALNDGIGVGVGGIRLGSIPTAKFSSKFSTFRFKRSPYSRRILPKRAMSRLVSSTEPSPTSLGALFISVCLMKYFVIFVVYVSSNYLLAVLSFIYIPTSLQCCMASVYSTLRPYSLWASINNYS